MIDPNLISAGARLVLAAFQASKFKESDDAVVMDIDAMEKGGATQNEISVRLREKNLAAEADMNEDVAAARAREQQKP